MTKKATRPLSRAKRAEIKRRLAEAAEYDALTADCEAKSRHGWAQYFREMAVGHRVYAWETRHLDDQGVWLPLLADVQRFVNQLWADLGYTAPPIVAAFTVKDLEEQPNQVAYANEREIRTLGDRAKANLDTIICHEAAHVIAIRLGINDQHGPNWFGLYLSLLERLGRFDMAALKASAAATGLEWAPMAIAAESLMAEAT